MTAVPTTVDLASVLAILPGAPATVMQPVTDLVCVDDVDAFGREALDPLECLAQDVYHTFLEAYGTNLDVLTRGVAVVQQLSGTVKDLRALARRIDQQLAQDSRIGACHTTLTLQSSGTYELKVEIQVQGALLVLALTLDAANATLILRQWGIA